MQTAESRGAEHAPLLACFAAALHSSRADLLAKPRPPNLDNEELRAGVGELAESTQEWRVPPGPAAAAISILLRERAARWSVAGRGAGSTAEPPARAAFAARAAEVPWPDIMGEEPTFALGPSAALSAAFDAQASDEETILAFHGTPIENVWSIFGCGLLNAAQVAPSLGRGGQTMSLFGQGIYLSTDPRLAASYTRMSSPLPFGLGRWSCLLVCEVKPGPLVTVGGAAGSSAASAEGRAPKEAREVPEGYIVVEDAGALTIRRALLWRRPGGGSGFSLEFVLAIVVLIAVALYALFSRRSPRRYF